MVFELLKLNYNVTDNDFDRIYPKEIRMLASQHWTSISVAKAASNFLVKKGGTKVLDIGSGVGKFCLIGAVNTGGHFTGVEQRFRLFELSQRLANSYRLDNVNFIHANITSINFHKYDAFYFFNSFYENIDNLSKIDNTIDLNVQLYRMYSLYLTSQFASLPVGTRLVTYCTPVNIIPGSYKLQDSSHGGLVKFWEKAGITEATSITENTYAKETKNILQSV